MDEQQKVNNNPVQWWKIAICVLGVVMIAGAVTYALITRTSASAPTPATGSPATSATTAKAPNAAGTGEMQWVINLNSKWATNDYILVVFPGSDDLTSKVNDVVKSASEKMREAGTAVEVTTLEAADPEFQPTLDRLAIQKLPAVLVFAASGQGAIVKGDITETKLLQAYLTLQKTCAPGAGSSCCPK